jgi:hypothetical protein
MSAFDQTPGHFVRPSTSRAGWSGEMLMEVKNFHIIFRECG